MFLLPSEKDGPPPYAPSSSQNYSGGIRAPSNLRPTNFVSIIHKNGTSVKRHVSIDPAIRIPAQLLPPLAKGETANDRKNFKVVGENAEIELDIALEYGPLGKDQKRQRSALDVQARNTKPMPTIVRLHRDASTSIPFLLKLLSKRGDLTVHLPRSFAGLLFLTAIDNGFHFSEPLSEHLNILDETDKSRKCFIGDIAQFDDTMWEGGWKGDEVILCAKHGVVNIQYTDDPAPLAFPSSQGLPNIYLSFNVQDTCIGSVVCRLYDDVMPRTAQAFRSFAITREATFMKSGLIFNDKQQLFLGEALNWVVEETRTSHSYQKPHQLWRSRGDTTGYWWMFPENSKYPRSAMQPFGEVVSGLDVLEAMPPATRVVISDCGVVA